MSIDACDPMLGGWRVVVDGGWWVLGGGWWLVVGGWWLVGGESWVVAGAVLGVLCVVALRIGC